MTFELTLEVKQVDQWATTPLPPTTDSVAAAIETLAAGASATITLSRGNEQLWAGGGPEWFNVWAITGPDAFFDLIGDGEAKGTRELAVGGQVSEIPARHCVTSDAALRAFWGFLSSGHLEVSGGQWERQGPRA